MLAVGSVRLFAEALGAVDVRRASLRRINETAWDVGFIIGVENDRAAAAVLDFGDGISSPVTLGNSSLTSEQLPYPDTWRVGQVKHTYTQPRNYSVSLTIASQVNERWTVQAHTQVSSSALSVISCEISITRLLTQHRTTAHIVSGGR